MLVRLIQAKWLAPEGEKPQVIEADLTMEQILEYNSNGFNVYYWPNFPSDEVYEHMPINPRTGKKRNVKGMDCDVRGWCFVDMDLKDEVYKTKDEFVALLKDQKHLPTKITDTGNGIHAYWQVKDLDDMSFLRLMRRLAAYFGTDVAVCTLNQIMRMPGTLNVKDPKELKLCEDLFEDKANVYDAETLDKWLPLITVEQEQKCQEHYDQAYGVGTADIKIPAELPKKFIQLMERRPDIHKLYYDTPKGERSEADMSLGGKLFRAGFTKDEALAVLCRVEKAMERSPGHRINYAMNIINKIWVQDKETHELEADFDFQTAEDIGNSPNALGARIPCAPFIDATVSGFRRTEVMGLIGAPGGGKSTFAMNLFAWFTELNVNMDYIHVFVTLEMTKKQAGKRWHKLSEQLQVEHPEVNWNKLVYFMGNQDKDNKPLDVGLEDIKIWVQALEKRTGKKVGCVVIDHIGLLSTKGSDTSKGEYVGLKDICRKGKLLAIELDVFLIMQSQTSRAKAGDGSAILGLDSAFGTSFFEQNADYIVTIRQPLKRLLEEPDNTCPMSITAYRFCKIREYDYVDDDIQQGVSYLLRFDPKTTRLCLLTSDEERQFPSYRQRAVSLTKEDRKGSNESYGDAAWVATKRNKKSEEQKA